MTTSRPPRTYAEATIRIREPLWYDSHHVEVTISDAYRDPDTNPGYRVSVWSCDDAYYNAVYASLDDAFRVASSFYHGMTLHEVWEVFQATSKVLDCNGTIFPEDREWRVECEKYAKFVARCEKSQRMRKTQSKNS